MAWTVLFTVSGLAILALVVTKSLEEKRKRSFFVSRAISRGDANVREFYHRLVHFYSTSKEKGLFFFNKQIPIHSRNFLNKLFSFLKEKQEQYLGNMRDARILKKSDGISEFFKNMSNVEKGNGEINESYESGSSQDARKELK